MVNVADPTASARKSLARCCNFATNGGSKRGSLDD